MLFTTGHALKLLHLMGLLLFQANRNTYLKDFALRLSVWMHLPHPGYCHRLRPRMVNISQNFFPSCLKKAQTSLKIFLTFQFFKSKFKLNMKKFTSEYAFCPNAEFGLLHHGGIQISHLRKGCSIHRSSIKLCYYVKISGENVRPVKEIAGENLCDLEWERTS